MLEFDSFGVEAACAWARLASEGLGSWSMSLGRATWVSGGDGSDGLMGGFNIDT